MDFGVVVGVAGVVLSAVMAFFYLKDRKPYLGKLSWHHTKRGVGEIIRQLGLSGYRPDIVVGIHTVGIGGGAIVAEMLAAKLGLPLSVVCFEIHQERDRGLAKPSFDAATVKGRNVLLVDDITNTGRSVRIALDGIEALCKSVKIAVVLAPPESVVLQAPVDFFAFRSRSGQVYKRDW